MKPIRIRLRTVRRALSTNPASENPDDPTPTGEVRITDGTDPDKWVVVKLTEEEYRGKRYAVLEVVDMAPGTRIAFVSPDLGQ